MGAATGDANWAILYSWRLGKKNRKKNLEVNGEAGGAARTKILLNVRGGNNETRRGAESKPERGVKPGGGRDVCP